MSLIDPNHACDMHRPYSEHHSWLRQLLQRRQAAAALHMPTTSCKSCTFCQTPQTACNADFLAA